MADEFLYSELFNHSPKKPQKKDSNTDILNSLFQMEAPPTKKKEPALTKNKNEQEINLYLSSLNKPKTLASAPKPKQTYTPKTPLPPPKSPTSSAHLKPLSPKPVEVKADKKQVKYMPTVVDIFAKKQDKSAKSNKEQAVQKQKDKLKKPEPANPKISKTEALKEKIQRKKEHQKKETSQVKVQKKVAPPPITKKEPEKPKTIDKEKPILKKKKPSSSSSSSSESEDSSSDSQDWRKHLRGITGYDPGAKKFRERDHMEIKQSGVDRIFGQDKFSYRMGRMEEEEDLRQEERRRLKKLKKKEHRR